MAAALAALVLAFAACKTDAPLPVPEPPSGRQSPDIEMVRVPGGIAPPCRRKNGKSGKGGHIDYCFCAV